MRPKSNLAADGALVLTALIWGSTFFMAKDILTVWPPVAYMFVRFAAAAILLALMFPRRLMGARGAEWRAGATLGLLMAVGFGLQAAGQVYTTASKSAFVTGLTTPLVPFVAYLILRVRPTIENLCGVALASLGGLLILAPQGGDGGGSVNTGDLLTLGSTALFAMHITLMSVYARRHDVRQLTVLQVTSAAVLFTAAWAGLRGWESVAGALPQAFAREGEPLVWSASVVWQLVYLATVATVGSFLCWTWGQARTTATRAAVIFSLEPVFATAFAVAVIGAGEWMGGRGWLGAGLVFAGIIISEMRWSERRERKTNEQAREAEVT